MPSRKTDFQRALRDPKSVYDTPEQVLADPRLDRHGKRTILETWKQRVGGQLCNDTEAGSAAEPNLVRRVDLALCTLEDRRNDGWRRMRGPLAGRRRQGRC